MCEDGVQLLNYKAQWLLQSAMISWQSTQMSSLGPVMPLSRAAEVLAAFFLVIFSDRFLVFHLLSSTLGRPRLEEKMYSVLSALCKEHSRKLLAFHLHVPALLARRLQTQDRNSVRNRKEMAVGIRTATAHSISSPASWVPPPAPDLIMFLPVENNRRLRSRVAARAKLSPAQEIVPASC